MVWKVFVTDLTAVGSFILLLLILKGTNVSAPAAGPNTGDRVTGANKVCGIEGIIKLRDGRWMASQRVESGADKANDKSTISEWKLWDRDGVPILETDLEQQKEARTMFPQVRENYIHSMYVDGAGQIVVHHSNPSVQYGYDVYNSELSHMGTKSMTSESSYAFFKGLIEQNSKLIFYRSNYAEFINSVGYQRLIQGFWFKDKSIKTDDKPDLYHNEVKHTVSQNGSMITSSTYGHAKTAKNSYGIDGIPTALKWFEDGSNKTFDRFLVGYYYYWGYYDFPRDHRGKFSYNNNQFHRLANCLVGCPQVWCVEADVDGAVKSGKVAILIRNFHVFYFDDGFGKDKYATKGIKISEVWPEIRTGYIDAVASFNNKFYIFKKGVYWECDPARAWTDRGLRCAKSQSISTKFKISPDYIDAAQVTKDKKLRLFYWDVKKQANMYTTYDTKFNVTKGASYTWSKWQFLPKYIDAIYSDPDKDLHYFFRNSFHYEIEGDKRPSSEPRMTMGNFFRCNNDIYGELPFASNFGQYQSYLMRFKPEPAPRPTNAVAEGQKYKEDDKKGFQWWWLLLILLLLLLLLLLLWCCLRRRKATTKPASRVQSGSKVGSAVGESPPASSNEKSLRSGFTSGSAAPSDKSMRSGWTAKPSSTAAALGSPGSKSGSKIPSKAPSSSNASPSKTPSSSKGMPSKTPSSSKSIPSSSKSGSPGSTPGSSPSRPGSSSSKPGSKLSTNSPSRSMMSSPKSGNPSDASKRSAMTNVTSAPSSDSSKRSGYTETSSNSSK